MCANFVHHGLLWHVLARISEMGNVKTHCAHNLFLIVIIPFVYIYLSWEEKEGV